MCAVREKGLFGVPEELDFDGGRKLILTSEIGHAATRFLIGNTLESCFFESVISCREFDMWITAKWLSPFACTCWANCVHVELTCLSIWLSMRCRSALHSRTRMCSFVCAYWQMHKATSVTLCWLWGAFYVNNFISLRNYYEMEVRFYSN